MNQTDYQRVYFSLRRSQKTELLIDLCYRARKSACTVQSYFKQGTLPQKLYRPFWIVLQNKGYVNSLDVPEGYETQLSIFSKTNNSNENQKGSDPQRHSGHHDQLQTTVGTLRSVHGKLEAINDIEQTRQDKPRRTKGGTRASRIAAGPEYTSNLTVNKGY